MTNRFNDLPTIICLMGPTASGKTQLAIDLVQKLPLEIISVDSAMVYRGMNIGTAKPSDDILKIAPHRLLDIRDPADAYSAAQFRDDALVEINDIIAQGKTPLLVGGTMLYFSTLQKGLSDLPTANPEIRAKLTADAAEHGLQAMHERLKEIDPTSANRIHPNDAQRLQRALEVYEVTGKSLTHWQQKDAQIPANFKIVNLAVTPLDRSILHQRIAERFDIMLTQGFLGEAKALFHRGDLTLETPAIRSVGYRQAWEYFLGNITQDEMREKSIIATRQLAKRQLTWLRNWPHAIEWLDSQDEKLLEHVLQFLQTA